jgi:hypothetical protein
LKFKRSIEKFEKTLAKKKEELEYGLEDLKINFEFKHKNSDEGIFMTHPDIFTKEFNILEFMSEIGKKRTFAIVCGNIFEKYNLFTKIYKGTFINFIDEMNLAYVKQNHYHNVFIWFNEVVACC